MTRPPSKTANARTGIGIPIERSRMRAMTERYLERMLRDDAFADDDYVAMVRLWNTIDLYALVDADELYRRYADAFFPGTVERASNALDALPTKGMALYSSAHDLYIGGKPHANSQYLPTDAPASISATETRDDAKRR